MSARKIIINDSSFITTSKFCSSATPIYSGSASAVCTLTQKYSRHSTFCLTSTYSSSTSVCSSYSSSSNTRPIFNTYREDYCNVMLPFVIEERKLKKKTRKKEDEGKVTNRQGYCRLNNKFEDEDTEVQKEDKEPEKNQWSKMVWEKLTTKGKNKKKEESVTKLSPMNPDSNLATSDEAPANSCKDIGNKGYTIYKVMWNCKTCNLLNKALNRSCEKCHMPRVAGTNVWV